MLNKSWASVSNFEIFWKFASWKIKARIFSFFFLHKLFLWNAFPYAHLDLVIPEGREMQLAELAQFSLSHAWTLSMKGRSVRPQGFLFFLLLSTSGCQILGFITIIPRWT